MAATTSGATPNSTLYHQSKDAKSVGFINFHENFTNTYAAMTSPQILPVTTKDSKITGKIEVNSLESSYVLKSGAAANITTPSITTNNNNNNNANSLNKMTINLVEKVHNYSKNFDSNRVVSAMLTPIIVPLDLSKLEVNDKVVVNGEQKMHEEHDYEDGASGDEGDDAKTAPDHHARRPMNAFLMFCKRHRSIVKERYPNLENRSITKILGDWWGSLDAKDKSEFKGLANEYKTEFLDKNKSFQWYKLPAPPLRTLTTRPGNIDRPSIVSIAKAMESFGKAKAITYPSDKLNRVRKSNASHGNNMVGMFRFADEAQMGGLSSLMTCGDVKPKLMDNSSMHGDDFDYHGIKPNHTSVEPLSNMRSHAEKMESVYAQMSMLKRDASTNSDYLTFDKDLTESSDPYAVAGADPAGIRRSSRACKGKRYKEFMSMAVNGLQRTSPPMTNKKKRMYEFSSSESNDSQDNDDCVDQPSHVAATTIASTTIMDFEPTDHMYASLDQSMAVYHQQQQQQQRTLSVPSPKSEGCNAKPFGAIDYDLEKKILELPAMDLDKYLSRKRDTKHKKKITVRRPMSNAMPTAAAPTSPIPKCPRTIEEARERIKAAAVMVGSQKRKARKESITRRISESCAVDHGLVTGQATTMIPAATESPAIASSLFMLATIAEVAANLSDSK